MANKLVAALSSESKIRILKLLLLAPDQSFYQREIAERTGLRLRAVQQALQSLVDGGIVKREARGRQVFYQADASCPILAELTAILLKTVGLAEVLKQALESLAHRIQVAFVFGSMATGEAVAESDVDLMVVGEVGLRELVPAIRAAGGKVGREVNPITMGEDELRQRLAQGDPFLTRVLRGPKIFLIGDEDELRRLAATEAPAGA
jgi:DNA-binding transcriptional ArsR family regulator